VCVSKAFVKGGLLGTSVFGIYDFLISKACADQQVSFRKKSDAEEDSNEAFSRPHGTHMVWMQAAVSAAVGSSPLLAHFGAGALAGLVQSIILDIWDISSYWLMHKDDMMKKQSSISHMKRVINTSLLIRRAVHHSVGFATLFGTFECVRRVLIHSVFDYFSSGSPSVPSILNKLKQCRLVQIDEEGVLDMTVVPMGAAFLAGGVAGPTQFVANHYTRHWKLQTAKGAHATKSKRLLPKPPSLRGTSAAFAPTALCFLAFQYGGELTERWLDDEDNRQPFPVYIWSP
jgi:hypothetical protein